MDTLSETFLRLVRLLKNAYSMEAIAPRSVEVTMFRQPDRKRYVVSLVNFQNEMPNIPVSGIEVRLRLREPVKEISKLPEGKPVQFAIRGEQTVFLVPHLDTLAMFAVGVG